ncbi:MAG: cyclic nucleotide-binding domain-containing protein [candidate division KSB1 bacterium]|nr:cyclic nucleotide-binding domain-containing protein [candidate division KSB1 bacterium]MDZ7274989.1 cyclic nucleotide-binding domain-containing protein [candidate division KSB1 bacterium]MDZ7286560.1 cyclic nucleotide-binding domain-containing protein [candidate division KSB1 bacterium]MDZ7299276.1 cyclic nucleotide-binding domain-containing protein [candidate division KSB1 bacterium]MDZ7306064.1 cyclic nucleotide-binding domain-containing protein [candidate division KSB1 bacterium]
MPFLHAKKNQPATTGVRRMEQYRDRWSALGAAAGLLGLSERLSPGRLRQFELFSEYDEAFLEEISPDVAIARWQPNAILFEEGAYLDLAFFIVQGTVEIYLQKVRNGHNRQPAANGGAKSGKGIVFLSSADFNLPAGSGMTLGPGELFGEIGAVNGWPQSVTARTATECVLAQIRVPALRRMKRKSRSLKERLDKIYRERSLLAQLQTTPLLQACEESFLNALASRVELVSCEPGEVVARAGEKAGALYLVRSGFLKLSQPMGEGEVAVSYLAKGMTLGEVELLVPDFGQWLCTATSVEFTELIQISRDDLQALLRKYPAVRRRLWESAVARIKETGYNRRHVGQSEFIHTALDKGLVQGSSMLVIDLVACTRCDDCVRGCAETHGGRPRFVREGDKYENFLIAKSCYHCHDPVCLIGCPTGAIHRARVGEVVTITDDLCIGCRACANNCPYDAIIMHETGEVWPANMLPEMLRGQPRLLASKCDLCYQSKHGPACVINCPHGCAHRVGSVAEFQQLRARKR